MQHASIICSPSFPIPYNTGESPFDLRKKKKKNPPSPGFICHADNKIIYLYAQSLGSLSNDEMFLPCLLMSRKWRRRKKKNHPSTKHQDQTQPPGKNEPHATLGKKHGGKEDKACVHEAAGGG